MSRYTSLQFTYLFLISHKIHIIFISVSSPQKDVFFRLHMFSSIYEEQNLLSVLEEDKMKGN